MTSSSLPLRDVAAELVLRAGTSEQKARLAEGSVPLKRLCREIFFSSLSDLERWRPIQSKDLSHASGCRGLEVAFTVQNLDYPPYPQCRGAWVEVVRRAELIGKEVDVNLKQVWIAPRKHVGSCACGAKFSKLSALVHFFWVGMIFSREYAL